MARTKGSGWGAGVNAIHCVSEIGIKEGVDGEDIEHWGYIFKAFENHFKERLSEVYHNVCFCHKDFTIYLNGK